jgi:uncharacterized membrane protein (DUF2068 family)
MVKISGFRTVALFEFLKGSLVLSTLLIFSLNNESSVKNLALKILAHIHPRATDLANLRLLFWLGLIYSMLRFIETYGLWRERDWGRKFAIFSTAIYLPFELFEMHEGLSLIKIMITVINCLVLTYLILHKQKPLKTPIKSEF